MKDTSGYVTKEKAHELIGNHEYGITERVIIRHGNEKNNWMDVHKCILWGDYYQELDSYGYESYNKRVVDEFRWEERTPEWILKNHR